MVTEKDFYNITWNQCNEAIIKIGNNIKQYCLENNCRITHIVPILRGGGILGIYLSHILNISRVNPCQYKYMLVGDSYEPFELLAPHFDQRMEKETCILVTEGNHCYGKTAQKCIDRIYQILPETIIIYASLVRDVNHLNSLNGTVYETYGFLSNDSKSFSVSECKGRNIPYEYGVFPWESIEEEMEDINSNPQNQ